jgi:hypothetical protein
MSTPAIDAVIATFNANAAALHVELAAYKAWHDEQGVAIVPQPELVAALQAIVDAGEEIESFLQSPTEAEARRLFGVVQKIGLEVIWWTGRLRTEREALKKGLH